MTTLKQIHFGRINLSSVFHIDASWVAGSRWLLLALIIPLLAGCHIAPPGPAAEKGKEAPVTEAADKAKNATDKADKARAAQLAAITKTEGMIKANVEDARDANNGNPDGHPKTIIAGDLGVVTNYLKDVPADLVEVAAVLRRRALVEQGKTAEAMAAYDEASAEADALADQLKLARANADKLQHERDVATAAANDATQKYIKDAEAAQKAHEAEVNRLQSAVRRKQVLYLNIAGAALVLLFGLGVGFGGVAGARIAWPLGVIGVLCFGLAQLVSQWWFMWACAGVGLIGLGLAGWWVYSHYKLNNLHQALAVKSSQLQGALGDVIPVLDHAYDNADQAAKELLDKLIFEKLSCKMDASTKGVIHQVRANIATSSTNLPGNQHPPTGPVPHAGP